MSGLCERLCERGGTKVWRAQHDTVKECISGLTMSRNTAKVLHITPDGSCLGKPGEETELFPCWSPDKGFGSWLCPQVWHSVVSDQWRRMGFLGAVPDGVPRGRAGWGATAGSL